MTVAEEAPPVTPDPPQAAAEKPSSVLFEYSQWIHLGHDAEKCEHAHDAQCDNAEHFHAWIRLPNPFQVKDIGEKARAAMARRKRMLRDKDSDAYAILELEMEDLRATEDKDGLVDEIVDRDFEADYVDAVREVEGLESEEPMPEDAGEDWKPPKLYANTMQDREELMRQEALPPEQQDADVVAHLRSHLSAYEQAVSAALRRRQDAKREALLAREWDDLLKMAREDRIESLAHEAYIQTFNMWQWFICTYRTKTAKGLSTSRVWGDINQMKLEAPPEVIEAVRVTFRDLEQRFSRNRSLMGNF